MSRICCICGKKLGMLDAKCLTKDKESVCQDDVQRIFSDKSVTKLGIKLNAANAIANYKSTYLISLVADGKKIPINSQLDRITEQVDKVKADKLVGVKPILKALPSILDEDEEILCATNGNSGSEVMLLLSTNKRFLAVYRAPMGLETKSINIPLSKINDLSYKSGMVFAKLFISNGSQNFKFTNLSLNGAKALTNSLNEQLNRNENTVSQNTVTSSADEIVKFKKLADDGIITQEEFEAKKKQLLDL